MSTVDVYAVNQAKDELVSLQSGRLNVIISELASLLWNGAELMWNTEPLTWSS